MAVRRRLSAAILACSVVAPAAAQVPVVDTLRLEARAAASGAYNLPDAASLAGQAPRLNDRQRVAVRVEGVGSGSDPGVWFGGAGSGEVVITAAPGVELYDPFLGADNQVVYELIRAAPDGLYLYDPATGTGSFVTAEPGGATAWGAPQLNASGQIGYRAAVAGSYLWVSWDGSGVATHVAEVGADPGSPYSLLFPPAFNDARQLAGKLRLGLLGQVGDEQPDQIRIFASDGSSQLIAEDRDSNPASPFVAFDDQVWLTNSGWVAFVAERDDGNREVILSDGVSTHLIASEAMPEISVIEAVPVAANDAGMVVFCGIDGTGLQAVAVGDGTTIERVATENDTVMVDLGLARIDRPDVGPVMSGGLAIDGRGDVAFLASLTDADDGQVDWGVGLFTAVASSLYSDGFEDGGTGAWTAVVP